ncbi:MAG: hypothetical protein V5A38_00940 [Halolamina sp.]|uniref:DUF7537 family lipoprotein n=1 Tax=Halolamina sp. TaxID=1940283 RepID=UPI002FC31622
MSLPSEEAFTRLYRALDGAERTAFVADLWAARGWETTTAGEVVVATRDGTEQRIRIVDPGWFAVPTVEDTDVLVTARDREAVEAAADAACVRYVPPPVLFDQLRYGIDRETAGALFESTFGQPFDAPDPHAESPLAERLRQWATGVRQAPRDRVGGFHVAMSVLLAILLVGAVVVGPALSPNEPEAIPFAGMATNSTEAAGALGGAGAFATEASNSNSFPPGIGENGIEDLDALVGAHERGVIDRERTLRVAGIGPPNATFMVSRLAWNYTVRVKRSYHYRYNANYTYPPATDSKNRSSVDIVRIDRFANGGTTYRRRSDPTVTSYITYPTEVEGGARTFTHEVTVYLQYFLDGERSRVDCSGPNAGDTAADAVAHVDVQSCRVVVTGAPSALPNAAAYRATATVTRTGVVRSLSVRYTLPDSDGDGEREPVRFWIAYESLDSTTVSEPEWLPEAKNETSN